MTANILTAKLDNVKNISLVLKAINFKQVSTESNYYPLYLDMNITKCIDTLQSGVCFASDCGLKVVVEDSKCVQANAFIGNDIFQVISIHSVVQCRMKS